MGDEGVELYENLALSVVWWHSRGWVGAGEREGMGGVGGGILVELVVIDCRRRAGARTTALPISAFFFVYSFLVN